MPTRQCRINKHLQNMNQLDMYKKINEKAEADKNTSAIKPARQCHTKNRRFNIDQT